MVNMKSSSSVFTQRKRCFCFRCSHDAGTIVKGLISTKVSRRSALYCRSELQHSTNHDQLCTNTSPQVRWVSFKSHNVWSFETRVEVSLSGGCVLPPTAEGTKGDDVGRLLQAGRDWSRPQRAAAILICLHS